VSWLEAFRDRVVRRSQMGRRRIDATFTRRELDEKLRELGARFVAAAQQGKAAVPQEFAALVQEVRELERRLGAQMADIAVLEAER